MAGETQARKPKILILATLSGGYAGADSVGQLHTDYAANTYVFPVRSPGDVSRGFLSAHVRARHRCHPGDVQRHRQPLQGRRRSDAALINRVYPLMKQRGIDTRRLRLVAICTVCTKAFVKEVGADERTAADHRPGEGRIDRAAASGLNL